MRVATLVLSAVAVALIAALVAVPNAQVVMRSLFGLPFIGAEELTRFLLICLVFVSYPLVVEAGENIVMGEVRRALPRRVRAVVNVAISVSAVAATGFFAWVTWRSIFQNLNNATPTLGIPFWIFLGAALFGFAGAALVHLIHLRKPPQADTNVSV
jgi:TRAP-type C4-dicarboxylate transport system permease small subunit